MSEEVLAAGFAAWEATAGTRTDMLRNAYLAMRSKDHSIDDVERVIAEAIASTSEGNGNAVAEAAARIAALVRSKLPIDRYAQPCSLHEYIQPNCPACGKLESAPIGDDVREEWSLCFYGSPPAVFVKAGIPGLPDSRRDIAYMEFFTNEEWETTGKLLQKLVSEHNAAITAIGSQSIEGERAK